MPSVTYDLLVRAMAEEKQVGCVLRGRPRVFSVIILGHTAGKEVALAWQTGGESSHGLPPGGAWRNITLSELSDVRLLKSDLQRGRRKKGEQRWVADVDLDVNPDSPYQPRRRLEDLRRDLPKRKRRSTP